MISKSFAITALVVLCASASHAGPAPGELQGTWSASQCEATALRHVIEAATWEWIDGNNSRYLGEADFEVDDDRLVVTLGKTIEAPAPDAGGPQEGDVITYRIMPEGLKPISVVRDADTRAEPEDVPVFHHYPQ